MRFTWTSTWCSVITQYGVSLSPRRHHTQELMGIVYKGYQQEYNVEGIVFTYVQGCFCWGITHRLTSVVCQLHQGTHELWTRCRGHSKSICSVLTAVSMGIPSKKAMIKNVFVSLCRMASSARYHTLTHLNSLLALAGFMWTWVWCGRPLSVVTTVSMAQSFCTRTHKDEAELPTGGSKEQTLCWMYLIYRLASMFLSHTDSPQ